MNADYIGNWLALGACIYGGKTADAALQILGLRRERKERRNDIDTSTLICLREKGLTLREIAAHRIVLYENVY